MSRREDPQTARPTLEDFAAGLEPRLELAFAATALKDVERAGWVLRNVAHPESVADHSYGTALLCLLYAEDSGVDVGRAVTVALVHDLAEVVTGDHVARADPADREVTEAVKAAAEREAVASLPASDTFAAAWLEYENRSTPEAVFVRDMNLIDMCLQALRYEAELRYDPARPIPSAGDYVHLDEFFASAEPRLAGEVARRLFASIRDRYRALRERRDGAR